MSIASKKKRRHNRYMNGISQGSTTSIPSMSKPKKHVKKPHSHLSLSQLLAFQEERKFRKRMFRKQRAEQKPELEKAKRQKMKLAKRAKREMKQAKASAL